MFNYDWFHGAAYQQQREVAKWQCALAHFSDVDAAEARDHAELMTFHGALEARTLIYLRDGFSYEIKKMPEVDARSHLVFECVPVDEQYKVGTFIVALPFEDIARVEVFAVHPDEKPEDLPQITGFRGQADAPEGAKPEASPGKKMPTGPRR